MSGKPPPPKKKPPPPRSKSTICETCPFEPLLVFSGYTMMLWQVPNKLESGYKKNRGKYKNLENWFYDNTGNLKLLVTEDAMSGIVNNNKRSLEDKPNRGPIPAGVWSLTFKHWRTGDKETRGKFTHETVILPEKSSV